MIFLLKRFLLLIGVAAGVFLLAAGVYVCFGLSLDARPNVETDIPVVLAEQDDSILIVNNVDGYAFSVPKDSNVDLSRSEAGLTVYEPLRTTFVFCERVSADSIPVYLNYSKNFLANTVDHTLLGQWTEPLCGGAATVTQWSRPALSRVENDKPYYTCIDLCYTDCVYTFLIKSAAPIEDCGGYRYLFRDFSRFTPSCPAEKTVISPSQREKDAATLALYEQYFSQQSGQTWGFFQPEAPLDMAPLLQIEQELSYTFPLLMTYTAFHDTYDDSLVGQRLRSADAAGRPMMLTLQTMATADGSNMVYDILDGQYDSFLTEYAQAVADFGKPMLMRIGNEMNGDWCTYCAYHFSMDTELYRLFYQYIVSFFDNAGANNVLFVWNPNERSFPDFKWNHMAMYYPDCGADIFGITGYNNGTYYPGEVWRSFREIYDPIYTDAAERTEIPIMITEFSCSDFGGDKALWLEDMFRAMPQYDKIKVAIWWNSTDYDAEWNVARQYRIDHDQIYLDIFKKHLAS